MEENSHLKSIITILVIVVVAAAVGAWFLWFRAPEVVDQVGEIGGQVLEKAQNPIKGEVAETNPFKVEANPFSTDLNPYKEVYTNPFEK